MAALKADVGGGTPEFELKLEAENVDLGKLMREFSPSGLIEAAVSFDAEATGRGGTLH